MENQASITGAVAAYHRGDFSQARQLAEEQLGRSAQDPALLHLMGLIEWQAGRIDAALEWLKQASEEAPGDIGIRTTYARLLADMGWIREALVELEESSRLALAEILTHDGQSAQLVHLRELGLLPSGQTSSMGCGSCWPPPRRQALHRRRWVPSGPP